MKRLAVLACALLLVATPAGATPNPPHNTPIEVSFGACHVLLQHGNYGQAYSEFKVISAPGTCYKSSGSAQTKVTVVSYDGTRWYSNTCPLNGPCETTDHWHIALRPCCLVVTYLDLYLSPTSHQVTQWSGL